MKLLYKITQIISAIICLVYLSSQIACTSPKPPSNFSQIDFTSCNGWDTNISMKMDSTGKIYVCVDNINHHKVYYQTTLTDPALLDSIQQAVQCLIETPPDSVYNDDNCKDCSSYRLVITTKGGAQINSYVADHSANGQPVACMGKIMSPLLNLAYDAEHTVDSLCTFKSLTREFIVTPPPPIKQH